MVEDFNTLEEYAKCVLECLKINTHDYQMANDSQVCVVYATAPMAYAKEQEHFANGENVGPLITFYQSGIEVNHDEQCGAWKYLPLSRKEGNYLYKAPIICKIKYTVTISALTELQADMLCAQIMQATPFHRPYYTILNGQFVLIQSDEYTNVSSVEAGDNSDKVSRREMILTIDRAYLDYDIKELNAGKIRPKLVNREEVNPEEVKVTLSNGVSIMKDGSIKNGEIDKDTGTSDGFFNYNIVDDEGNVLGTTTIGTPKITMGSISNH